jgi:hypothetical protein
VPEISIEYDGLFLKGRISNEEVNEFFLGPAVAQLVEALHYKPAGRGFDSRWCQSNFFH